MMAGTTMLRLAAAAAALVAVGTSAFWALTLPVSLAATALPPYAPNLANGRIMFAAGGCASCHAVPNRDPDKVDRLRLGGGLALKSPFGTFHVPNISPDPADGIGRWSEANFVSALWKGTGPDGNNLYPAFPYTSYQYMRLDDVRDLFAFLKTLPAVHGGPRGHDLRFPFNIRRLVGAWKVLYLHGGPLAVEPSRSARWNRGAYLVNGPGHCAECHSPRNRLGAIVERQRFAGGPAADGDGWVPNITPAGLEHGDDHWTPDDIASFLGDGMTPSGDLAGGQMADVIRNTSMLSHDDRAAMADYIATLPPRQGPTPPKNH